jgi:hypothetical protein
MASHGFQDRGKDSCQGSRSNCPPHQPPPFAPSSLWLLEQTVLFPTLVRVMYTGLFWAMASPTFSGVTQEAHQRAAMSSSVALVVAL